MHCFVIFTQETCFHIIVLSVCFTSVDLSNCVCMMLCQVSKCLWIVFKSLSRLRWMQYSYVFCVCVHCLSDKWHTQPSALFATFVSEDCHHFVFSDLSVIGNSAWLPPFYLSNFYESSQIPLISDAHSSKPLSLTVVNILCFIGQRKAVLLEIVSCAFFFCVLTFLLLTTERLQWPFLG